MVKKINKTVKKLKGVIGIIKQNHNQRVIISLFGVLFGVLTIYLNFFNTFFESLANYLSKQCLICTSYLFELLNMSVGIIIIFISLFFIFYSFKKQKIDLFFKKKYLSIIVIILIFLISLTFLISVNKCLGPDEVEHIHSAWYIKNGKIPYSDFFQHHHPLFWYSITPILLIFGDTVNAIIIIRVAMFILTLGIAFLTYLIAKKVTNSEETGLLSVLLLLSMVMFIGSSTDIRPDVPQVLFGLISVYYLINFFQTNKDKYLIFSGICASISFLFLQKTIFLLLAYALIFIFKLLKRKTSIKQVIYFLICFSSPIFLFLAYLIITESFGDYLLTNWILNMHYLTTFSPFVHLKNALLQNGFFWLLSIFSIIFILLNKGINNELKTITFIGIVLLLSVFLVKCPHVQYFMFAIPLLCISIGFFIKSNCNRFKLNETCKILLIMVIIASPSFFLLEMIILSDTNHPQLEKINFVIQNSASADKVYDPFTFNLYRNDLHYFWFPGTQLNTYNEITNNKYGDYNICELIKSKKPKFISDVGLNFTDCKLDEFYHETNYNGLFVKR